MSTRERKLVMLLAVFGLFGLLFGAYQLVWQPIQDGKKKLAELRDDLGEKQEKLEKYQKDRRRLDAAKKRSLPANPEDARREYEAVLGRLLRSAGVTAPNVVPKDNPDTQRIPQIEEANGRKRPAYSRVGFEITLKKVDLPTVAKFLEGYYGLNLLQQITHFEIKRTDAEIAQAGRRGAATGDRTDLEVKLVTEAIILDGAENRKTLLPVPTGGEEALHPGYAGGIPAGHSRTQRLRADRRRGKTPAGPPLAAVGDIGGSQ